MLPKKNIETIKRTLNTGPDFKGHKFKKPYTVLPKHCTKCSPVYYQYFI